MSSASVGTGRSVGRSSCLSEPCKDMALAGQEVPDDDG